MPMNTPSNSAQVPPAVTASIYDGTFPAGVAKPVLTPAPAAQPLINGAAIFGVRPGKPVLYKIAATGQAPLLYSAQGLPPGVTLDPRTGLISGRAPTTAGRIPVSLTVSNALGEAHRLLDLVVGNEFCLTPPLAWNSWYAQSEAVSDASIRRMADAMAAAGLVDHGWSYINIDDCWSGVRHPQTKAIQGNEKFPDMAGLTAYIHGKGMKCGIYNTPWMSTYAGYIGGSADSEEADYSKYYLPQSERNSPGQYFGRYPRGIELGICSIGKQWLVDRDAKQFAEWGFDYVKYDWKEWTLVKDDKGVMTPAADKPVHKTEAVTKRFYDDFRAVDRDIVISLSPDHSANEDSMVTQYTNLWRLTHDILATWEHLKAPFAEEIIPRYKHTRPGHYGDLDMLQIGNLGTPNRVNTVFEPSPLTGAEQYLQVSLWCLLSQPMLLSCDLASLDAFTLNLITNDEVLALNQDALVIAAHRVAHVAGVWEVWQKPLADGSTAVGLFNLADEAQVISVSDEQLGLSGARVVRDLWRQKDIGALAGVFSAKVEPHGVVLVGIRQK